MDYPKEPTEVTEKSKTIALLRQAVMPLIKDKASSAEIQEVAEALYSEMGQLGERLEKRIDQNKPADVDMSPIAELMVSVAELSKREISNEVIVDMSKVDALTEKVADVIDYLQKSADAQAEFMKSYKAPTATPSKVEAVKITNFDDFKNVGQTQSVFTSKFPFLPSSGQGNVAARLVRSNVGGNDALPVVNADGSPIYDQPMAVRVDDFTTTNVVYIGKAIVGSSTTDAVWQITKIDNTAGMIRTWADGNADFDNVWGATGDVASLTFS